MSVPPLLEKSDIDDESQDLFASALESPKDNGDTLPSHQSSAEDLGPSLLPVEDMDSPKEGLFAATRAMNKNNDPYKVQNGEELRFDAIKVNKGIRHGDGMGAYILFEVKTTTNLPVCNKSNFAVQRRFSDFLGLHERLVNKYLRNGRVIPPAPEKSVIGMTKIKMSGPNEQNSSEFLERRRASLERYLQRTAAHHALGKDPVFKDFLLNESELPKATNTSALTGAGMKRFLNKVGETVNKITYRMDENDTWFEEKTQEIECLESGLRKLINNVEALVFTRKELASLTGSLARTTAMLSNCEEHRLLSLALVHLNYLQEKIERAHNHQANTDMNVLCEFLKEYIALIGAVKNVFHERVKVYQNWQHALLMLNRKREHKAKMDLSNRADKGNFTANEIEEWEKKEQRCQEEFNNISEMIKKEMDKFKITRVNEFKVTFLKYMEQQMVHQQQLIGYWETFLPEAKAIV